MFATFAGFCFVLNAGSAAYLLARADLGRGKKTVFAALALASVALKLFLATRGHNYDLDSYRIVAALVLRGQSVYAHTSRFNYGPLWAFLLAGLRQISTSLPALGGEAFHVTIAAFLAFADVTLAALLAAKYRFGAGIFFLCCPAAILLTGYHSQFEDFALLVGLAAWLLIRSGPAAPPRLVLSAALLGASLMIKHILFLFPIWVLCWEKAGSWRKRVAFALIAYGIFGASFLPWMFDPASRAGIITNVFRYRSEYSLSLSRLILPVHPFAAVSPAISSVLTLGWVAAVIAVGILAARRQCDLFPAYLLAVFAFSPALRDQYLAIPLVACAILYTGWPGWALVVTASLALFVSPAEIFAVPFGMVYYIAMVSTQICAFGLLLLELRRPGPPRPASLPLLKGVQSAATLAVASPAAVFLLFLAKISVAGAVTRLINR